MRMSSNVEPLWPEWKESRAVNWKVMHDIDNEGYHVPIGHPGLYELFAKTYVDYADGDIPCAEGYVQHDGAKQWAVGRYQKLLPTYDHLPPQNQRLWFYFGLFPNAVFELHPDCVSYYMTIPVSPTHTLFKYRYFALPDPRREARLGKRDCFGGQLRE